MKRFFNIVTMVTFSTMLFTECGKEQEDTQMYHLSVDKTELVFTADVTSQIFSITASGEWHIEADGLETSFGSNEGSTDWYSVKPMSGNGGIKVTVELIENIQLTTNTATLKIIGQNNKEITITITIILDSN